MKSACLLFSLYFLSSTYFCQTDEKLIIYHNSNHYVIGIITHNGKEYFSLNDYCHQLAVDNYIVNKSIVIDFGVASINLSDTNPFAVITRKSDNQSKTIQFPVSPITLKGEIHLPKHYGLELLSSISGKKIIFESSDTAVIEDTDSGSGLLNDLFDKTSVSVKPVQIYNLSLYQKGGGLVIRISSDDKITSYRTFYRDGSFVVVLKNAMCNFNPNKIVKPRLVKNISVDDNESGSELKFDLNFNYHFSEISTVAGTDDLVIKINVQSDLTDWFITESEHFTIVYRESHSFLVPHLLRSAESSLKLLMKLFDYTPSEKIIINTYDVSDYGFGAATTVPQNYIRLGIEPFEPGYENTPYHDRFQWVLNHELVHIVVNDQASKMERLNRSVFSKVAPEQTQPITVFYSLLTNYSRYTPRWHQEAIAVFMETWMSGGYGRILGNFDEMYFRTMVLDGNEFPHPVMLEAKTTHNSFLLETLFYLYGGRFAAYLSINYGSQKLIDWFKTPAGDFYGSFSSRFKKIFGIGFNESWKEFIEFEIRFQKENIRKLESNTISEFKRIKDEKFGWTTQPHFDPAAESILFGYHKPSHLASIVKLDLYKLTAQDIGTLPTPSQFQVASSAFDYETGLFFYTTNNNLLYRDVWVLNIESGETKLLFKDSRIGHLTVSPKTHELWGIMHSGGKSVLVYSPYPYNTIEQLVEFRVGEEVPQLSVSPSGKFIAITLLKPDGQQSIILAVCESLLSGKEFKYKNITSSGSPENPSWSEDEKFIFWNAYTNGVSNIYKQEIINGNPASAGPVALSHTLRGFFRPVYLNRDLLFAFEFTAEGFIPVIIPNKAAGDLPAIQYLGQEVVKKNSEVYNWYVQPAYEASSLKIKSEEKEYSGLSNLKILTFIPVISGFQKQKMLGIYTHISDPLIIHDIHLEAGYSPFNENPLGPRFHFKGKYEFKKKFEIGVDHNAPDFYDLFNERKRGLIGSKFNLGYTHYWVYDNPLKIKQQSGIAFYKDIEFINDNLIRVSEPDFLVAQTNFNSKNLRRTIGSSDYEYGNEFNVSLVVFGANPKDYVYAGQIFGEWDHYTTLLFPHNVFHFKLAAGFHNKNNDLYQARFFFGGFGNRALENVEVRQYRNVFRFPGVPIYSIEAENFGKLMIENCFPPLRFGSASLGQHFLNHIDFSVYSQILYVKSPSSRKWIDLGAQLDFVFKHWFNLESTLSAGIANAWFEGGESWEWFVSYKLLRN
jgi:hypothetical protein